MATIAQLRAERDRLQALYTRPYTGADSRAQQQQLAAQKAAYGEQLEIVKASLYYAQTTAVPITQRNNAQLEQEIGKLVGYWSRASTDGGSFTKVKAAHARKVFAAAGGEKRTQAVTDEMQRRGIWEPWLAAHQPQSLWVSVFRPLVKAAVVGAAVYYGATLMSGSTATAGATAGQGATVADTYAAMNSAAGITTSGSAAADVALASAVQTGTMTAEAANAYAASIAAGTVSEAAVVEGVASLHGGSTAATVATVSTSTPINNEVLKTGVDMATVTAEPTGMDALFASIGDAANQAVAAAGTAAANKILGKGGNDPVQAQAAAQNQAQNTNTGMMVVGGIAALLLIALMLRA